MTAQPTTPNHAPVTPGATIWTWCSACMDRTDHRYEPQGKVKLICEECEKEKVNE